jgi:hypothetical protein
VVVVGPPGPPYSPASPGPASGGSESPPGLPSSPASPGAALGRDRIAAGAAKLAGPPGAGADGPPGSEYSPASPVSEASSPQAADRTRPPSNSSRTTRPSQRSLLARSRRGREIPAATGSSTTLIAGPGSLPAPFRRSVLASHRRCLALRTVRSNRCSHTPAAPILARDRTVHARHRTAMCWGSNRFLGPTAGPTVISANNTVAITAR